MRRNSRGTKHPNKLLAQGKAYLNPVLCVVLCVVCVSCVLCLVCVSCVLCLVSCVLCLVSCVLCLVSCVLCLVSCVLCLVSCVLCCVLLLCLVCLVSCVLCLVSCVLCLVSCVLCLVSCVLCLVSCVLCLVSWEWGREEGGGEVTWHLTKHLARSVLHVHRDIARSKKSRSYKCRQRLDPRCIWAGLVHALIQHLNCERLPSARIQIRVHWQGDHIVTWLHDSLLHASSVRVSMLRERDEEGTLHTLSSISHTQCRRGTGNTP